MHDLGGRSVGARADFGESKVGRWLFGFSDFELGFQGGEGDNIMSR